ncbi:MAG: GIY-YIG nuclease family protein [Thiogranum sp.]
MAVKKKVAKRKPRNLVTQRLERVSKDVFRKYFSLITELIGNSPGIYALYDENELYYVGKSTDLKVRVRQHLKDRHLASWTHFSLYLVRNSEHIHEIESLVIRIANPEGNRVVPKGRSRGELLRKLKKMVRQKQREEMVEMFGSRVASRCVTKSRERPSLEGLVTKRHMLYRAYKGKEYKAFLTRKGTIRYGNKSYTSPSGAARAIAKRNVNGWTFWFIKDLNGDWIRLRDYRE